MTQADTAQTLGSGDVPLLGTPKVLALVEAASVMALTRHIPTSMTTVGTRVDLQHRRPIPLGDTVYAQAILRHREGDRLMFDIRVVDSSEKVVAEGHIERVLVDREEFMSALSGA